MEREIEVGDRILARIGYVHDAREFIVLEISPSGTWLKFKSSSGYDIWERRDKIKILEHLTKVSIYQFDEEVRSTAE